ncbi:hypothetical protein OS493_019182 [Desmophyllum pertusum]|uniref:Cytochrome P450 n=1 Tax=Desmophyllum pertusum TaxID=174260 RepID=A0A9W9YBI8_9CNID|nr:hypothetical protein OS493_019182 [Desmophyllum pertusum]
MDDPWETAILGRLWTIQIGIIIRESLVDNIGNHRQTWRSPLFATIYDSLNFGNVLLLFLLLLMLHYLMVLYEFRNMPPGPRLTSLPVLGNVFSLNSKAEKLTDAFKSLKEKCGRIFSMKLGSYKFVMASTPEAVNEMLVKNLLITLVDHRRGKDIIVGNYGPEWKFQRKTIHYSLAPVPLGYSSH